MVTLNWYFPKCKQFSLSLIGCTEQIGRLVLLFGFTIIWIHGAQFCLGLLIVSLKWVSPTIKSLGPFPPWLWSVWHYIFLWVNPTTTTTTTTAMKTVSDRIYLWILIPLSPFFSSIILSSLCLLISKCRGIILFVSVFLSFFI